MLRLGSGLKLTGAFVPTLKNLFLSASSVLETVTSGTTVGALTFNQAAGSTLSLIDNAGGRFVLSGTNINTVTLPDVAVDTVYKITVQETNAGFAITSRLSDIYITVTAFVAGLTARSAPTLSLSSNTTYPPPLIVSIPGDAAENDILRIQSSASVGFGTTIIDDYSTLDAAAIAGGSLSVTGLSAIITPTQTYFRASVNGGAWSAIVKHGDTVAPTITSGASPSAPENTANPTGALTANEDILSWAIVGGADAATFSLAGATWTLNATPDFETKTSYVVQFRATDYGGNATTQTMTLGITDVVEVAASTLSATFKHSLIDVTGGGLIATAQVAGDGGRRGIRSDQARSGKGYFEVLINNINTIGDLTIGVCDVNMIFAGVQFEKPTTKACYSNAGQYVLAGDGSGITGANDMGAGLVPVNGDRMQICYDTVADKVWFGRNNTFNGDPAAGTGGWVLPTGTTAVYAMLGLVPLNTGTPTQFTINFGATAFTYTPPSGFTAMT